MSRVVCRADCLSSTASANVAAYALSAFGGLPSKCLGQKIRDNDRFPRTGHSKQDAMLRSVSEPRPYPDKIASGAIVNCLRPFQVPGEPRGPGNQVRQVGVFGGQIERPVGAKGPSGSRLIEELARVLGNSRVVDDGLPIDRA